MSADSLMCNGGAKMGKTRFKAIQEIMKNFSDDEVHLDKIRAQIRVHISSREKGIEEVLKTMAECGFIKENPKRPFYYKLKRNGTLL